MHLDYLDFDFSDEEDGRGSFDAMASVTPERLPALQAEIDAVLRWAAAEFGSTVALDAHDDAAEWDYALQSLADQGVPPSPGGGPVRTTLTLTLSGSPAFCDAFRRQFRVDA